MRNDLIGRLPAPLGDYSFPCQPLSGIIIVDKPSGWTSHDVVAKLRGALRIKRIGHGGTLDPMATGVLPVFVGRATRAAEFCENADKEYIAGLKLGIVTNTQDITGNILSTFDYSITAEEISSVISRFLYAQKQIPPMYSAIKIGGKKLYELARRGEEIKRPARNIYISEIDILDSNDDKDITYCNIITDKDNLNCNYVIRVVCSKGTYIRTLCHDIGTELGCGAAMSSLRRTRAGAFTLVFAKPLDEVIKTISSGDIQCILLPIDIIFKNYPAVTIDEVNEKKCKNGALYRADNLENGKFRVYATDGEFLALASAENNILKSIKSFF
jgi:tRNA pseudouridine55 synthase